MPCFIARKAVYVGALIYPLRHIVRYWISWRVWTVMCMIPQTQWFKDPPCDWSIFFSSSPMIGVSTKSVFSKEVSIGNGDGWNLTSSFVFVSQYSWIKFFMMWSIWSILMSHLLWIMLMLRIFIFKPSWKVK